MIMYNDPIKILVILVMSVISGILIVSPNTVLGITPVETKTPTNLVATAVSPTQITLSWDAPTQNYGKIITGYKIEERLSTGAYNRIVKNTGNVITTYSLTGLTTNTTYTFRVSAAYSDDSSSEPSNPASATPTATSTPPQTPPISSAITNVKLDFTPSDGTTMTAVILTQNDYQLLQYKKDSRSIISNPIATTEPVSNTVDGLLTYQKNHLSPPDVPGTLIAESVLPTKIKLSWLHPTQNYGKKMIGYKVDWKRAPGDYVTIDDNTGNTITTYYVDGLKNNTLYTYRVSALYSDQTTSNPSNEATTTTLKVMTPVPQNTTNPTPPSSSTTPPPNTQPTNPTAIINVKFDFRSPDGTTLSDVVISQNEYQQILIIKDPRSILSNVVQTNTTANNSLAALLKYQEIHAIVQTPVEEKPIQNTPPTQNTIEDTNSKIFYGVITSVISLSVIGTVSWFVKTKITKKILKEYYFTLDKSSSAIPQLTIRNSGPIIEDCTILCENIVCVWMDTNLDKPRHIFEGSITTFKLPNGTENHNPMIIVKSGKRTIRKIRLDEISNG